MERFLTLLWFCITTTALVLLVTFADSLSLYFTWWYIKHVPNLPLINALGGFLKLEVGAYGGMTDKQICSTLTAGYSDKVWVGDMESTPECRDFISGKAVQLKNAAYFVAGGLAVSLILLL